MLVEVKVVAQIHSRYDVTCCAALKASRFKDFFILPSKQKKTEEMPASWNEITATITD